MAECRLRLAAVTDLDNIFDYTARKWGIEQAVRYTQEIWQICQQVAEHPEYGVRCDHIRLGYRVTRVERHKIYFRIIDDGIDVVRILHDRMDSHRYLKV